MWFVFKDGPHFIRAWASYWIGLECIYFGEEQIAQTQKREDNFNFEKYGASYRIEFCTRSVSLGHVRCALYKNGSHIQTISSKRRKVLNTRPVLVHIGAGVILGTLMGLLHLPAWAGITFIMLSLIITLLTSAKKDDFVIEHINTPPISTAQP